VLQGTDKPTEISESAVFQGPWRIFKISEFERICLTKHFKCCMFEIC